MTNERLNNEYLEWLSKQITDYSHYRPLLGLLHEHEFVWLVANDDNRIMDARDLRDEFTMEKNIDPSQLISYTSVLEVLVALSRRLEFQHGMASQDWALQLLENLQLKPYMGFLNLRKRSQVEQILDDFIWRRYSHDGTGGLFPLAFPHQDQTEVELWYQMSAYLEELEHRKEV